MKFIKIIYFDEGSVADFMQIVAGGELKKTTEFISDVGFGAAGDVKASASIGTDTKGVPKLFSFLSGIKLNASAEGEVDASYKKNKVVRNILENTLLSDFISLLQSDKKRKIENQRCKGIKQFKSMALFPEPNSFSFIMLAAPFFSMINGDVPIKSDDGSPLKLDISKIEEAMKKGRGYYEFIAIQEDKEYIFRFSNSAFRNNYTMSDLPKMQLTLYAIYVGKVQKSKLQIEREFEFGTKKNRLDYSGLATDKDKSEEIDVFDVILAGVEDIA